MWGLHPIHVPLEQTVDEEAPPDLHAQQRRKRPSDAASQEGETSHLQAPPRSSHYNSPDLSAGSPHTRPSLDPSINFIFIDDDVSTLRKQLILIKNSAPQLQLPTHLLNKRPGLQSRRTRSSAQMKPNAGSAPVNSQLAVIYFTSLSKFRYIRERHRRWLLLVPGLVPSFLFRLEKVVTVVVFMSQCLLQSIFCIAEVIVILA